MALVGAAPSTGPGKKGRREGPQPHPKAYPRRKAGFWAPAFASSKPGTTPPHCPAHPPGPQSLGVSGMELDNWLRQRGWKAWLHPTPKNTDTQAYTHTCMHT